MKTTQLFADEFATIEADTQQKYIQLTWLQHTSHTDMRNVLLKASELARQQGLTNWLFDLRKLNFTTAADANWSVKELFQTFDLQQKHRLACVATPQNVEMMTGAGIRASIAEQPELADTVSLEVFISMESALQWLFKDDRAVAGDVSDQSPGVAE